MWIYLLSYQTPVDPVPAAFERYLANLEGSRILDNLWVVRGNLTAHALVASTRAFLGDESKIFVAEVHEDYAVHGVPGHLYQQRR